MSKFPNQLEFLPAECKYESLAMSQRIVYFNLTISTPQQIQLEIIILKAGPLPRALMVVEQLNT